MLVGEKLLEEGKVSGLYESERHLWIAKAGEQEVEIQITPSKVKACSCECALFLSEKMCGHVAAGLLALRKKLSEQPAVTVEKPRQVFHYQKLTINSILDNVSREDLESFVRNFAKGNRQFSQALKTRFAAAVPMHNMRDKYVQLLDPAIAAARNKKDHISHLGGKQLLKITAELLAQADDAIALEHYAEAFAILQTILEKMTPLLRKIEGSQVSSAAQVKTAFDKLKALSEKPIPTFLKDEIWQFSLEEFIRPAYRLNGFGHRFFEVLLPLSDDVDKSLHLIQIIDNELVKSYISPEYRAALVLVKLRLFDKEGMSEAANSFILELLTSPDLLVFTVETALAAGLSDKAKSLAEIGLRFLKNIAAKNRLEEIMLGIAVLENDKPAIFNFSKSRFLDTKEIAYFDSMREAKVKNWEAAFKKIVKALSVKPLGTTDIETLAAVFVREEKWEDLLELVRSLQSLDWLIRYDHHLLKHCRSAVYELLQTLVTEYLSNHLGIVPAQFYQDILLHLRNSAAGDIADKLEKQVRASFGDRGTLFAHPQMEISFRL